MSFRQKPVSAWLLLLGFLAGCGTDDAAALDGVTRRTRDEPRSVAQPDSAASTRPRPPPEQPNVPAGSQKSLSSPESTVVVDSRSGEDYRTVEEKLFDVTRRIPIGGVLPPTVAAQMDDAGWEDLGFVQNARGDFERQVSLDSADDEPVLSHSRDISSVDFFAMITIDRHTADEPYVYKSLLSFFAAFPGDVQINLFVGNDDDGFVAVDVLEEKIGPAMASRVHVRSLEPASSRFLGTRFKSQRRGGWNYARALRSYRGTRSMVLMEDDVRWAADSGRYIEQHRNDFADAANLYNYSCYAPADTHFVPGMARHIVPARIREKQFICTQGMYFRADMARSLGSYLGAHVHEKVWDWLMERYFQERDITVDFVFPALVQHVGVQSAGVTPFFHRSACYDAQGAKGM